MASATRYPCPVCGCLTLAEEPPGTFEVCPVCFWEDDPVQASDPGQRGGANEPSLAEARASYARIGAIDERSRRFVRPPRPHERRPG